MTDLIHQFWELQVRPWLGVYVFAALFALIVGRWLFRYRRRAFILKHGIAGIARVNRVRPTGYRSANDPMLRLDCWVQPQTGAGYDAHTKKLFSLMDAPFVRPGVTFQVKIHPEKKKYFEIERRAAALDATSGTRTEINSSQRPSAEQGSVIRIKKQVTLQPGALGDAIETAASNAVRSAASLRDRGILVVCTILEISPQPSGDCFYQVEIDRINQPRRNLSVTQSFQGGNPYAIGDRAYLLMDPDTVENSLLMSLDFTRGEKLPRIGNRLDGLVLANEILFEGSKAQGTVISAEEQPLTSKPSLNSDLEGRGLSKWLIGMHIVPENGDPPYNGEMTIAVTTREKAATISRIGAVLPVRYNSYDPQTLSIDTIALGFGDPRTAENQARAVLESAKGLALNLRRD